MAWTDIPNSDLDQNSPLDEDLYEALRDNDRELRIANTSYIGRYRSAWTTGFGFPYDIFELGFFMPDWQRWIETGREIEFGLNMQIYHSGSPANVKIGVTLWVDHDWTARTVGDTPTDDATTAIEFPAGANDFDITSQIPGTTGLWNYYTGFVLDDTWANGKTGYDGDGNSVTHSGLSFYGKPPWTNYGWSRLVISLEGGTGLAQVLINNGTSNDLRLRV